MSVYWDKAMTAARSARILLAAGDRDGAVSPAYYAMFDAAKAALESIDPALVSAKTHGSVIRRFGKHVVRGLGVDASHRRALNTAEDLRIAADYERQPIDLEEAREQLAAMEDFLDAIGSLLRLHVNR